MVFTESDLDAILNDPTKMINGDIRWHEDEDHSPAVEFLVAVESNSGYQLKIRGSYNIKCNSLGFSMLLGGCGRIYGLDIGTDHRNPKPENVNVGKLHKHKWTDAHKDKHAYVPDDITAGTDNVVKVWQEFCAEAKIIHNGTMSSPRLHQQEFSQCQ
jgi:hypothetical protein